MNVELAQKVLKQVRKHPERHDQQDFIAGKNSISVTEFKKPACGTAGCLAGWASAFAAPTGTVFDPTWARLLFPGGDETADVELYAREHLGLTSEQANALFYCMDNETAIKRLEYLTEHPNADWDELEKQLPEPEVTD